MMQAENINRISCQPMNLEKFKSFVLSDPRRSDGLCIITSLECKELLRSIEERLGYEIVLK